MPFTHLPPAIRNLIYATAATSLIAGLTQYLLTAWIGIHGLQTLLPLSSVGINRGWLWQPLTHLFIHGSPGEGLTFWLFVELFFHMYILAFMGSMIWERIGDREFLKLYIGSGLAAGVVASLAMWTLPFGGVLSGSTAPLLAILVVWTLLNPTAELLLFFVFPVKSLWLLYGLAGIITLVDLSQGDLIHWLWCATAITTGYLYATRELAVSPPDFLSERAKIFDIRTGKAVVDDEVFVDAMLEKISKHGKESLTWRERWRLKRAAKARSK